MKVLKRWCVAVLMIVAPFAPPKPQHASCSRLAIVRRHWFDLLELLAACEALRLRFNADRLGAAVIVRHAESGER